MTSRTQRNFIYLGLVFVFIFVVSFQKRDKLPARLRVSVSDITNWASPAKALKKNSKITVIALWTISKPNPPPYFPYFFHSVENNRDVDLLFIQIDKLGNGCPRNSYAPNVREVCLSEDEYHALHSEFLCKKWQCSDVEKDELTREIKKNGPRDSNNSFFRILRGGIFERYISADTTIWGWCDVDVFWGNFKRTFPWDLVDQFDIFVPTNLPEFGEQRLVYTRGHMAFFQNTPDLLARMHAYPKFESLTAFYTLPMTAVDAEESEFSHYMFSEETSFTFVTFDGMVRGWDPQLMSYGPTGGVFYAWRSQFQEMTPESRSRIASLVWSEKRTAVSPTFSDDGLEEESLVFTDCTHYKFSIWFDPKWCTFVEMGEKTGKEREPRAFIMRREPHGPITQRWEPRERWLLGDGDAIADEALYKHWKDEKRQAFWFHHLHDGLKPGEILVEADGR